VMHPSADWEMYKEQNKTRWTVKDAEVSLLKKVWDARKKIKKPTKRGKGAKKRLEISQAHSSKMAFR
jgi:hypothetical protein